jgi:alkylation response protein AidB-like acyl-CoA dehydrogenase
MGGDAWQQLYFEDCYVPPENVLLPAGGFKKQIAGFNAERIGNTSRALAVGRSCDDLVESAGGGSSARRPAR